jgi:VWFA-related protein
VVALGAVQQNPAVFRAGTRRVLVDVGVFTNSGFVDGLGLNDFTVTDNGVPQKVERVWRNQSGIEVIAVVDLSGSVIGGAKRELQNDLVALRADLGQDDTFRVVAVGRDVHATQVGEREPPAVTSDQFGSDGGTALHDAISVAMMLGSDPSRRRLVVALTDAVDNASGGIDATRALLVRRTSAVVYCIVFAATGRTTGMEATFRGPLIGDPDRLLRQITQDSGGEFLQVRPGQSATEALRRALDRMRSTYVIEYDPIGVDTPGWHSVRVVTPKAKVSILAKRGYFKN